MTDFEVLLTSRINSLIKENEQLKAKLAIVVETLEFYGDEKSWIVSAENEFSKVKRTIIKKENDCESFGYQASPEDKNIVVTIAGNLARQALEKLRGENENN